MKRENIKQRAFSTLGSIALVNFPFETKEKEKKGFAKEILEKNKSIKTVLEKSNKFSGRLRKIKTKHLAGEKTKEVLYKENGCIFRFNIDETYFSPRLANERNEMASLIKKNEEVFVAFAGVGPFSIVVAKNSLAKRVYSNELNRMANKYEEENIKKNKVEEKIVLMPGDFKKVAKKLHEKGKTFDVILMPRPQLKDSFLEDAFLISKKKTRIYYYDFCKTDEVKDKIEMIKEEAKKAGKKIKILGWKNAGVLAPYKIRLRVDFKVFN